MEIYVPKKKRQYGYFVMPILRHDRLIGRVDPLFDRRNFQLRINAIFAEAGAPKDRPTGVAVGLAIQSLAAFLGAKDIVYPSNVPSGWRRGWGPKTPDGYGLMTRRHNPSVKRLPAKVTRPHGGVTVTQGRLLPSKQSLERLSMTQVGYSTGWSRCDDKEWCVTLVETNQEAST